MTLVEGLTTAAVIIQAIYAAATFHRDGPRETLPDPKKRPLRPIIIVAALMITTWAAVGFDYYDRHQVPPAVNVTSWGVNGVPGAPGPMYVVLMNTAGIQKFSDDYKMILVARNASWPNVDPLNDTAIEKSTAYTITGPSMQISYQGIGKIRWAVGQLNQAEMTVVLLPNDVSPDQFTRMADAKRLGAKIVGGAGQMVVGDIPPPLASPSAAPISAK